MHTHDSKTTHTTLGFEDNDISLYTNRFFSSIFLIFFWLFILFYLGSVRLLFLFKIRRRWHSTLHLSKPGELPKSDSEMSSDESMNECGFCYFYQKWQSSRRVARLILNSRVTLLRLRFIIFLFSFFPPPPPLMPDSYVYLFAYTRTTLGRVLYLTM